MMMNTEASLVSHFTSYHHLKLLVFDTSEIRVTLQLDQSRQLT